MATTIITKYGSSAPTASDVVRGELAVDTENGRLYTEDSGGSIVEIGLNPSGNVDVTGTVSADGLTVDSGSTNTQLTLARSTTHSGISFSTQISDFGGGGADLIFDGSGNSTGFGFRPTNSSGTLQTGLVISPDGNVGIGTSEPDRAMKIEKDNAYVWIADAAGGNVGFIGGSGSNDGLMRLYEGTGHTAKVEIHSNADSYFNGGNVGIGTGSPNHAVDIYSNENVPLRIHRPSNANLDSSGAHGIGFSTRGDAATSTSDTRSGIFSYYNGNLFLAANTSDITADPDAYARLTVTNNGNVGIGTDSPDYTLDLGGATPVIRIGDAGSIQPTLTRNNSTGGLTYDTTGQSITSLIEFKDNGVERMRIDSSGNVLVNDTATSAPGLSVIAGKNISFSENTTSLSYANIFRQASSASLMLANGYLYTGTANGVASSISTAWAKSAIAVGSGDIRFFTDPASTVAKNTDITPTEAMRIDSSGNLLVGKTSQGTATIGAELGASGYVAGSRDGDTAGFFNRDTSDGEIIRITKDGTAVGSIGATGGDLFIGTGDAGLWFQDGGNAIRPFRVDTQVGLDNSISLGVATTGRFDDAFIVNGVTTGSDANDKQDIETLSDAEQRVAVACKGLLRKWRWKDAVEAKGDEARIHFGIIAQDLQAAFEAEGLDAGRYAMFMSNTWTDEETGEERTRLGVRYHELLAFIIAAI